MVNDAVDRGTRRSYLPGAPSHLGVVQQGPGAYFAVTTAASRTSESAAPSRSLEDDDAVFANAIRKQAQERAKAVETSIGQEPNARCLLTGQGPPLGLEDKLAAAAPLADGEIPSGKAC